MGQASPSYIPDYDPETRGINKRGDITSEHGLPQAPDSRNYTPAGVDLANGTTKADVHDLGAPKVQETGEF